MQIIDRNRYREHSSSVNGHQTVLRPGWRWVALVMLFAWVAAFGLCNAHCALGKNAPMQMPAPSSESSPGCHGGACPNSGDAANGSFCFTLKNLFSDTSSTTLQAPDAPAFLQSILFALPELADLSAPSTSILRQASPPDWIFTPEVYLGPAFRSHAPPVIL